MAQSSFASGNTSAETAKDADSTQNESGGGGMTFDFGGASNNVAPLKFDFGGGGGGSEEMTRMPSPWSFPLELVEVRKILLVLSREI